MKRLIRPLIPDRAMARLRLHQHSRLVRTNVDVFVDSRSAARRWLAATPDTYRVRLGQIPTSGAADGPLILVRPGSEAEVATALGVLGRGVDVAVVAGCRPPGPIDRRRAEPVLLPHVVAIGTGAVSPGLVEAGDSLESAIARLRSAGCSFGLVPRPLERGRPAARSDPITGETWVILSIVPMHDIGGGSRSAQLALELLRRGAHVVYVALYGSQESTDLGLRHVSRRLEQEGVVGFSPARLAARSERPGTVLVEAPAPELAAVAIALSRAGWSMAYDMIDDWSDPALGGEWHAETLEHDLVDRADAVVASAPDLVTRVAGMGRSATLVPNGVNTSLFGRDEPPPDGIAGDARRIIGYHGSLYGNWFDWAALSAVAEAFPDLRLVVIGDDKGHPPVPDNVEFLGLRAQHELPGYLRAMAVGIVPFRISPTTHAVSPLKAFEYLASGVPVAAPPLRSLAGLDGVHTDVDLVAAVRSALSGPRPDRARALREHGWEGRVDRLYRALGREPAPIAAESAVIVERPVVRYPRKRRLVKE